jgi:tRNA pseudouridine55 synthase
MESGLLLIDKPAGMSSAQVVSRVKRTLKPAKIGHAGTLDPAATGLLVCLLGSATRLASFAESGAKTYSGTMLFGVRTETDDTDGPVLSRTSVNITADELAAASQRFVGPIEQLPPQISAIKVAGVPAYERVRSNEVVELAPRRVVVHSIELEFVPPDRARYRISCSKGTYIRSVARDLGELLGCGGCIESLRRERSEPFEVAQARTLEEVTPDAILPWERLFPSTPRLVLELAEVQALAGGDQRCLMAPHIRKAAKSLVGDVAAETLLLYGATQAGGAAGVLVAEIDALRLGLHLRV